MDKKKKNLLPRLTRLGKPINIQNMSAELVKLSEKDLQKIVGGFAAGGTGEWKDR
jgi:bacteriocin-like protein